MIAGNDGPAGDSGRAGHRTVDRCSPRLRVVRTVLAGASFSSVGPPGSENGVLFGFFEGQQHRAVDVSGGGSRFRRRPHRRDQRPRRRAGQPTVKVLTCSRLAELKAAGDYSDDGRQPRSMDDDSPKPRRSGPKPSSKRFLTAEPLLPRQARVRVQRDHNQERRARESASVT